jgi:23S rRNA pseudouridine2605 synthase
MPEERLQKILARAGFGSRRASEELIASGRVRVNGKVASLGMKADPEKDRIEVDGRSVTAAEPLTYIALYKPRGVVSAASSPDARQTVRDLIPESGRLYPVGRLDVDSEGLILMTNDGALANRLTHPRYGHEKEYRVLVARHPDEEQLAAWRRGVVLEDGYRTLPADVRVESHFGKGTWLRVILKEGRKRQIRETGAQIGLPVAKIIRVRIGSLRLSSLKPREWRHLSLEEIAALKGGQIRSSTGRGKGRSSPEKGKPPTRSKPRKSSESGKPWRKDERGGRR